MQKKQILTLSLLAIGILIFVAIDASLLTERRIYAKVLSRPTLASTIDLSNAVARNPSAAPWAGGEGNGAITSGDNDITGHGANVDGGVSSGTDLYGAPPLDETPPSDPSDSSVQPTSGYDPFAPPADSGGQNPYSPPSGAYPAPGSGDDGSGAGSQPLPTQPPDTNPVPSPTNVVLPTQAPPTATQPPAAPALPTATRASATQPAATPTQAAQPTATLPQSAPALPTATPIVAGPTTVAQTAIAPTATLPPAQPTSAPVTPTQAQPPAGVLVSVPAGAAPKLDGVADDAVWAGAPAITVATSGGANHSATQVTVKSVYDGQRVYFLVTWADPSASIFRQPWEKQADGSWKRLVGAQNTGGDETQFYEDKLAFFWPIQNSLPNFNTQGCGGLCHSGENGKPYGNMYTAGQNQRADLWQMKAVRGAGQVDDQYLDNQTYSKQAPSAGFHPDPSTGGGYRENQTQDKKGPAYMLPNTTASSDKSGAPGFISEAAKVALDASLFKPGDRVPSLLTAPFEGDRGDISGAWRYTNGGWTLELSRKLVTGSPYDVQFDDLNQAYAFALATFDNAQLRHAVQSGALMLMFKK